jgi:hypothetical protein
MITRKRNKRKNNLITKKHKGGSWFTNIFNKSSEQQQPPPPSYTTPGMTVNPLFSPTSSPSSSSPPSPPSSPFPSSPLSPSSPPSSPSSTTFPSFPSSPSRPPSSPSPTPRPSRIPSSSSNSMDGKGISKVRVSEEGGVENLMKILKGKESDDITMWKTEGFSKSSGGIGAQLYGTRDGTIWKFPKDEQELEASFLSQLKLVSLIKINRAHDTMTFKEVFNIFIKMLNDDAFYFCSNIPFTIDDGIVDAGSSQRISNLLEVSVQDNTIGDLNSNDATDFLTERYNHCYKLEHLYIKKHKELADILENILVVIQNIYYLLFIFNKIGKLINRTNDTSSLKPIKKTKYRPDEINKAVEIQADVMKIINDQSVKAKTVVGTLTEVLKSDGVNVTTEKVTRNQGGGSISPESIPPPAIDEEGDVDTDSGIVLNKNFDTKFLDFNFDPKSKLQSDVNPFKKELGEFLVFYNDIRNATEEYITFNKTAIVQYNDTVNFETLNGIDNSSRIPENEKQSKIQDYLYNCRYLEELYLTKHNEFMKLACIYDKLFSYFTLIYIVLGYYIFYLIKDKLEDWKPYTNLPFPKTLLNNLDNIRIEQAKMNDVVDKSVEKVFKGGGRYRHKKYKGLKKNKKSKLKLKGGELTGEKMLMSLGKDVQDTRMFVGSNLNVRDMRDNRRSPMNNDVSSYSSPRRLGPSTTSDYLNATAQREPPDNVGWGI